MDRLAPVLRSYDLELDAVIDELAPRDDVGTVGLQFPDGLRDYATDIAAYVEDRLDATVLISADPSFGACDVALDLDPFVDVLVHFGHTEMPSVTVDGLEVHFVPTYHNAPVDEVVVDAARVLRDREGAHRIGVFTTAQHGHKLEVAVQALEDAGFDVAVGQGDNRVSGAGQVLGCNYTSATSVADDVDGFVFLGSGDFHPVAVRIGTDKPLVLADPYTGEVRDVEEAHERIMRQRYANIAAAQDAESFGILVGTHVGQHRALMAEGLQKMLRREGKEAHLIALKFFDWRFLQYFRHLDALVNTGCPRITTDDHEEYPLPMLTPPELEIALGRKDVDDYRFDEFMGTEPRPKGPDRIALGNLRDGDA